MAEMWSVYAAVRVAARLIGTPGTRTMPALPQEDGPVSPF